METIITWLISGLCLGFGLVGLVLLLKPFIKVAAPNEILVFSGRARALEDGSQVGFRLLHGGWSFQVPILETVDRMDLRSIPIDLAVTNAYSSGGIPLNLQAVAYVKVNSDPNRVHNAIERFLGRDPREIQTVAKETLEGHLRGILARMTPEEVNEDRLKFAEEMMKETDEDFDRLGLQLDALKVQSVSDDVSYLDSIGRERLANVLSNAEIAESIAKADAEEAEAQAHQDGQVAAEAADTAIKRAENAYRKAVAEFEASAKSEEERAEQAALAARAKAEQALQEFRAQLMNLRLQADTVLPADAARKASEMAARAEAATIAADGQALAKVLQMFAEAWAEAGDDAKDIFLIQQLEPIVQTVAGKLADLQMQDVNLLDQGDGRALARHVAALPHAVAEVFDAVSRTTGVDLTGVLAPKGGDQ